MKIKSSSTTAERLKRAIAVPNERKPGRKKVNSDQTFDSLLDAATKLFLAKGFQATSIGEIAAAAKLTKPTLYYYFDSKNELLYYVHMKGIKRDLLPYMEKIKGIADADIRFRTMIKDYTRIICSDPALRFLLHGTLDIKDKYSKKIKTVWKENYHLFRDTIQELQAKGVFRADFKASSAALLILGMIGWITFWYDYGKVSSRKTAALDQSITNGKGSDNAEDMADLIEMMIFQGLSRRECK
jgi:AcrR family transcriptional regulator